MATVKHRIIVAEICPGCSTKGRKVAPLTVRSLVMPELVNRVREETYRICESTTCDVVYFSEANPANCFLRRDMRVRVGQKETDPPIQVCYCFDWTKDDIEREMQQTGTTTVPDRIRQKVQQGFCHCETMNPQGSCCLRNVNRAVTEIRSRLESSPGMAGTGVRAASATTKPRAVGLTTLGAFVTAVLGSACCWLPLLLIAFGFSAAGVGSFFEQYRPFFLAATFGLLGLAWYLTYQARLWRVWSGLFGKSIQLPAHGACCANDASPAGAGACCPTELETAGRNGAEFTSTFGQLVQTLFAVRQLNQILLWIVTVIILMFAFFPHWTSLVDRGSRSIPAVRPYSQQVALTIQGMTCDGCTATIRQALNNVPGVAHVEVNHERAEAIVTIQPGSNVQPEVLIQAVRDAGYGAKLK